MFDFAPVAAGPTQSKASGNNSEAAFKELRSQLRTRHKTNTLSDIPVNQQLEIWRVCVQVAENSSSHATQAQA